MQKINTLVHFCSSGNELPAKMGDNSSVPHSKITNSHTTTQSNQANLVKLWVCVKLMRWKCFTSDSIGIVRSSWNVENEFWGWILGNLVNLQLKLRLLSHDGRVLPWPCVPGYQQVCYVAIQLTKVQVSKTNQCIPTSWPVLQIFLDTAAKSPHLLMTRIDFEAHNYGDACLRRSIEVDDPIVS